MNKSKCSIFWDYENCAVPTGCSGHQVVKSIRNVIQPFGTIKSFKAYLAISEQSQTKSLTVRSELQASGVSLTDTPHNGRKDVADKMMIVDMLLFAMDNDPPATLVLISGDRDFSHVIGVLRLRQYDVVLLSPPNAHASLTAHATLCLDWNKDVLHRGYTDVPVSLSPAFTPSTVPAPSRPFHRQTARYDNGDPGEARLEAYLSHQRRPSLSGTASHLELPEPSRPPQETRSQWSRFNSESSITSFATCNSSPSQSSESEQWTDVENDISLKQTIPNLSSFGPPLKPSPPASPRATVTLPAAATVVPPSPVTLPINVPPPVLPSDLKAEVPPLLTESQIAGPLPHQFKPLIKILQGYRERGQHMPFRPSVAVEVSTADRSVLGILPDDSPKLFANYAELARAYGVVDLGGSGGDAWISLRPKYYNFKT
ncbi:NYN domain-containing protein [Coprinopsis sp. MPI-PUGE-AT-0042]|nr:NYN domain-containing protein [Coprinopsis sp. MPI-PUGE-AT-0042]